MNLTTWEMFWDKYGAHMQRMTLKDLEIMKRTGLLEDLLRGIRYEEDKSYV